jgi:hypothetical protein
MSAQPRLDRSTAMAVYLCYAAGVGLLIAWDGLPEPFQLAAAIAALIGGAVFRSRVLHAGAWSMIDASGGLASALSYLFVAFLLGHGPFR